MAVGSVEPIVWPNTVQYKRALQRPDLAFSDPELKRAQFDADVMGTPASVEGQSAVVFFGRTDNARVTVRCLKRPIAYGERRYAALHGYLGERREAPLATVEWQSNGVSVDGRRWPIVRMEHVDGMSMRQYVSRYVETSAVLYVLSERWRDLAADLRRNNLAHGDLQQDNVRILQGGALRLIDLDAVWAPPLAGMPPREYGHRHFQHPERLRTGYWDAAVDTFSTLVIYISLRAVAADPTLWDRYHNDENLILADSDFENPGKTPVWARLAASRDLEVRDLVPMLEQFCKQTVRIESDLATMLRARTLPGGTVYVVSGLPLQRATWWADASAENTVAELTKTSPLPGPPAAEWTLPSGSGAWWPGEPPVAPPTLTAPHPTGVVDRWPYDVSTAKAPQQVPTPPHARNQMNRRLVAVFVVIFVLVFVAVLISSS